MIYQYLHGRDQSSGKAYGSINELDKNVFSKSDEDSLQRTIFYKTVPDIDINFRPECYYYYSGELANGYVSITGKTTYLLPGESPLSGERPSIFGHQYIFTNESQQEVMGEDNRLFFVSPYCCRLEDVKKPEQGKLVQCYDDKNQEVFGKEEIMEESLQELLAVFGIEKEDYNTFIYAVLTSCGSQEKRICLVLPENNKKGTDMARKLVQCMFQNLPLWLKENCGYMTYCSSMQNLFPANMQMIFIPRTTENVRSYISQEVRYYIFDKKNQQMPYVPELDDPDIKKIVENFKYFIFGEGQTEYYQSITAMLLAYGEIHKAFTPLQIKRLMQFWNARNILITENHILYKGNEWRAILDDILDMVPKLRVQIRKDMEEYAKTYMYRFRENGEEDWMLKMFYAILPNIKDDIVSHFCGKVYEDHESFIPVMHFTEDMRELNDRIKESIYNDSKYFEATKSYENKKLLKKLETLTNAKDKFVCVLANIDEINQLQCMFFKSKEYAEMIQSNLDKIIQKDYCEISEMIQFFQEYQDALEKYNLVGNDDFSSMFCITIKNYINEIGDFQKLENTELQELSLWGKKILKNPQYFEFEDIRNKAETELKFREQAAIFQNKNLEKIYVGLKKIKRENPEDLKRMFNDKQVLKDTEKIRIRLQQLQNEKIKRNKKNYMEEVFDGLYEICFCYDVNHRKEICIQIMESKWGGILSLSKIYKNVTHHMEIKEIDEIRSIMKSVVVSYYKTNHINAEERSALKEEIDFVRAIGLEGELEREEQNLLQRIFDGISLKEKKKIIPLNKNKKRKQEEQKKDEEEKTLKREIKSTNEEPFGMDENRR